MGIDGHLAAGVQPVLVCLDYAGIAVFPLTTNRAVPSSSGVGCNPH